MSEELQHLLEKIRTEGIARADAEARAILEKAREEAAAILADSREKADTLLKKADADSQAYAERGRKALEQASRDTILTVQQAVENLFNRIVRERVEAALTPEAFQALLRDVINGFLAQGRPAREMEITVSPAQESAIRAYLLQALQQTVAEGVTIRSSNEVVKGFRIAFRDSHVEHDYTVEAIAETMAKLVRPHLAELLRKAGTP